MSSLFYRIRLSEGPLDGRPPRSTGPLETLEKETGPRLGRTAHSPSAAALSEVAVVLPVPVIRVRRRKPLGANKLQFDHRDQRFMPVGRSGFAAGWGERPPWGVGLEQLKAG